MSNSRNSTPVTLVPEFPHSLEWGVTPMPPYSWMLTFINRLTTAVAWKANDKLCAWYVSTKVTMMEDSGNCSWTRFLSHTHTLQVIKMLDLLSLLASLSDSCFNCKAQYFTTKTFGTCKISCCFGVQQRISCTLSV